MFDDLSIDGAYITATENCAVPGYYAASSGNCHYPLRNIPEERSSQLLRGGSLNSRITAAGYTKAQKVTPFSYSTDFRSSPDPCFQHHHRIFNSSENVTDLVLHCEHSSGYE